MYTLIAYSATNSLKRGFSKFSGGTVACIMFILAAVSLLKTTIELSLPGRHLEVLSQFHFTELCHTLSNGYKRTQENEKDAEEVRKREIDGARHETQHLPD